jgi:hypothetical protein
VCVCIGRRGGSPWRPAPQHQPSEQFDLIREILLSALKEIVQAGEVVVVAAVVVVVVVVAVVV